MDNVQDSGAGRRAARAVTRILAIDDEPDMLMNYRRLLGRAGHECVTTTDPGQVESMLRQHRPDLVLTDLMMPNGSGMEVLERVHRLDPELPVILVTAHGSIDNAVAAMKCHATDYLTKPFQVESLLGKVRDALGRRLMERAAVGDDAAGEPQSPWYRPIVGMSPPMREVMELARRVARTDVNVLLQGESGTGKELFARMIHHLSPRRDKIFVPVDCASLPENLLESELFGYCKGAFTGATSDKMGLFQHAHQGTMLLDEISEVPLPLQAKFLRVLQERCFRPVGGRREIAFDVRVVAATNADLEQAVRERSFRSDLYYRLNVVTLRLPPLRERREDIPLLANHFLKEFARANRLPRTAFSDEALDRLQAYDWPGNVRQLQNVVERAVALSVDGVVRVEDLPEELRGGAQVAAATPPAPSNDNERLFARKDQLVEHFERDYLVRLLVVHRFNVSRAARAAGCHRRTLYRMIHRHGLDLGAIQAQRAQGGDDSAEPPSAAES